MMIFNPRNFRFGTFIATLCLMVLSVSCGEDDTDPVSQEPELPKPLLRIPAPLITEIDVDWSAVDGALSYELDAATDRDFTQPVVGYSAIAVTSTSFTITDLEPSTTYFIRIRAVFEGGVLSENSNTQEVTTLEVKVCEDPSEFIFRESGGIVKAEFENAVFGNGWELKTDIDGATGDGYMVWTGSDFFSKPSNDLTTFNIRISTPGTYRFLWNSGYTIGDKGTEHNDTWLRFPDAEDYYASKGDVKVYPKGVGKTPNPEGASAEGWFKIYRSGNDKGFKWQARTYDFDPHQIYVTFEQAKVYKMEVSARSNGHGVDKFLLHLSSIEEVDAINADFSDIICF
ncbi:MAG: fibronectin type III domain-containing protein [Cyclobacteriaceae bacterium]